MDNSTPIIVWLILIVLFLFIYKLLINWYFEIEKRNRYDEAQIRLLIQIALKSGADADAINRIASEAKLPTPKPMKLKHLKIKRPFIFP